MARIPDAGIRIIGRHPDTGKLSAVWFGGDRTPEKPKSGQVDAPKPKAKAKTKAKPKK